MPLANPNTTPRTIVLKDFGGTQDEALAVGIFTPGHCLKLDSAGKVLKTSVEGADILTRVATEAVLNQGKSIDDAYAVGDVAFFRVPKPGEFCYVYLKAGVSYAIGDDLIHSTDGTLKKASGVTSGVTVKKVVAQVRTALNLSATAAVSTRAVVEML